RRLAAGALLIGNVGAVDDHVEGPQDFVDDLHHLVSLPTVDEPAPDPALVADDPDSQPRLPEAVEYSLCPGDWGHSPGVAVVGDIDDESAVAVEQHRFDCFLGPG